jgi:hypothetical protein
MRAHKHSGSMQATIESQPVRLRRVGAHVATCCQPSTTAAPRMSSVTATATPMTPLLIAASTSAISAAPCSMAPTAGPVLVLHAPHAMKWSAQQRRQHNRDVGACVC